MSVRRQKQKMRNGKVNEFWMVDVMYTYPDGRVQRIRRVPRRQTRVAAEKLEREIIAELDSRRFDKIDDAPRAEVPTFSSFASEFMSNHAVLRNKGSEIRSKERILRLHLNPAFGDKILDKVTQRDIASYNADKLKSGLSKKTVNNHLAVLGKLFKSAVEWNVIAAAPHVQFLRAEKAEIDFLDFDAAARLVDDIGARGTPLLYTMVVVALNTGMRLGELLALRWCDVDLKAGKASVRRNLSDDGTIGTPKSGKGRELPLNRNAVAVLKSWKHNRGPTVFCQADGSYQTRMMAYGPLVAAMIRVGITTKRKPAGASARAGKTSIDARARTGWHMLRHTFASHLVMKGVPLKAIPVS